MAVNGIFTYEDLYANRFENYRRRIISQISSSTKSSRLLTTLNIRITTTTTEAVLPALNISKLISWKEIKTKKLVYSIPSIYFYWFLIVLAVLLALVLVGLSLYYCCIFIKNCRIRR